MCRGAQQGAIFIAIFLVSVVENCYVLIIKIKCQKLGNAYRITEYLGISNEKKKKTVL